MNIVVTCPRYFPEIANLKNHLGDEANIIQHNPENQGFNELQMESLLKGADIAVVGDDHITDQTIQNLQNLKLIVKWGVGVDNIEINKKSNHPVIKNSPADIHIDVAEHTVFLIGLLYKKIHTIHDQIRNKNLWPKPIGNRISNKNIGLIGYGTLGKQLSMILKSFDTNLYFFDPNIDRAHNHVAEKSDLKLLAKKCEIIIISASLTKESENLINKDFFDSLLNQPILVNVSRGKIVNENDLIYALKNNLISGCALDVFESEPISKDSQLKTFENVVFSSHNASNTQEANDSVNSQVTEILLNWLGYD